jgi:hypothetical protein
MMYVRSRITIADPLATPTVEIEVVRWGMNKAITFLCDLLGVLARDPHSIRELWSEFKPNRPRMRDNSQHHCVVRKLDLMLDHHLLPHHCRLTLLLQRLMRRLHELIQLHLERLALLLQNSLRLLVVLVALLV